MISCRPGAFDSFAPPLLSTRRHSTVSVYFLHNYFYAVWKTCNRHKYNHDVIRVSTGRRLRNPSQRGRDGRSPLSVRPESGSVSQLPALRQRAAGRARPTGRRRLGRLHRPLQRQRRPLSGTPPVRRPLPAVRGRLVHRTRLSGRPHVVQLPELSVLLAPSAGRGAQIRAQAVPVRRL